MLHRLSNQIMGLFGVQASCSQLSDAADLSSAASVLVAIRSYLIPIWRTHNLGAAALQRSSASINACFELFERTATEALCLASSNGTSNGNGNANTETLSSSSVAAELVCFLRLLADSNAPLSVARRLVDAVSHRIQRLGDRSMLDVLVGTHRIDDEHAAALTAELGQLFHKAVCSAREMRTKC